MVSPTFSLSFSSLFRRFSSFTPRLVHSYRLPIVDPSDSTPGARRRRRAPRLKGCLPYTLLVGRDPETVREMERTVACEPEVEQQEEGEEEEDAHCRRRASGDAIMDAADTWDGDAHGALPVASSSSAVAISAAAPSAAPTAVWYQSAASVLFAPRDAR